jgi:hypothetical protein
MPEDNNGNDGADSKTVDTNSPEFQNAVAAAVKAATDGLAAKKDELLGEKKKLQGEFDAFKAQFEGIDPEGIRKLMADRAQAEEDEAKQKGDFDTILANRDTRHTEELAKVTGDLTSRAEKAESFAQNLVQKVALGEAMRDAKILPQFMEAAQLMLAAAIQVRETDDGFEAFTDIDGREVEVGEYVRLWAEGDKGKHFVQAAESFGGGSQGKGNAGGGASGVNPWKAGSVNLTQQGQLMKVDPNKARQLMKCRGIDLI